MESSSVRLHFLNEEEMVATRDWRKALRSQPAYRIVNKTIRGQTHFITIVSITGIFILICLYLYPKNQEKTFLTHEKNIQTQYNYTYPLTRPILKNSIYTFRIGIIADLDTNSLKANTKNTWYSYLKTGYLIYDPRKQHVNIKWDNKEPIELTTNYALKGRGMELSELVVFNGKLLTFDDRTGLVYEIIDNKNVIPWILLMDGDGKTTKGFKSEWATVKNEQLYIGSMGKEWTTANGDFENSNPQFIKKVTIDGKVEHINWIKEYNSVREILNIRWPGYMIHESAVWSDLHKKWYFLPRRCSTEKYDEVLDEKRGCSALISADENFKHIHLTDIFNTKNTRGFSSFKFIPSSNDSVIVALRTEEINGKTATYIMAFTVDGTIIMDDQYISDVKYEGLEFI